MKKIGTTSSGTVIVEMTSAEFEASLRTPKSTTAQQPVASAMTIGEKVAYVRERIAKLGPKKKEGVVHSISAMFQFSGGIPSEEIERIISLLQKEKFLAVAENGRVTYEEANQSSQPTSLTRRG